MSAVHPADTVDRLQSLPAFASVPRSELEWVTARSEVQTYETGAIIRVADAEIDEMFILLDGHIALSMQRGGGSRTVMKVGPGYVLGVIPYSRFHRAPGNLVVEDTATAVVLHRSHFPALIRECPSMTETLVHQMLDRTREFRTLQLQDERMQSLGRLASGLAHELNNPASAAMRGAQSLSALLDEEEAASRALAAGQLGDSELDAVDRVRTQCCSGPARERTALELADREDDLAEWLARHGLDTRAAEALARCELRLDELDGLATALPGQALGPAVRWVASGAAARQVAREIESAIGRVHDLVGAVKGFTFMDREGVPAHVDVARGLADTIAMLEAKSRAKSVVVQLETASDLPPVYGFGSEINQVWEKLIDNAIDAARSGGSVMITARSRGDDVIVGVADDGPGIAHEYRARVFDPFFTTKPVGQGTGLGLDVARRVVHLHHGDVEFTSQPGRTVFRVRLPVTGVQPARMAPSAGDGSR